MNKGEKHDDQPSSIPAGHRGDGRLGTLGTPAIAQAKTKIRIGYLHTLAVDGQMWLAEHLGALTRTA